jgi:UV DNA damage endonuclease
MIIRFGYVAMALGLRSHADYVNSDDFLPFLHIAKESNTDLDVMIEAKQKDQALFKLIKDLEKLTFIKVIDQATVKL